MTRTLKTTVLIIGVGKVADVGQDQRIRRPLAHPATLWV